MEAKITAVAAVSALVSIAFIVYDCCEEVGRITATMDLPIQALKTYLMAKYGLSGADWDPYSYLGRAPLVNYPILPFLFPALLTRLTKDPMLSCSIAEIVYRAVPVIVWLILFLLSKCSSRATVATLTYLISYPVFSVYDAHYVRIATTMYFCSAVVAIIIWHSRLGKKVRETLSILAWFASVQSNFVYSLVPLAVMSIMESPKLLVAAGAAVPPLALAYWAGKLEFDNPPASSRLTFSPYDTVDVTLVLVVTALVTVVVALSSLLEDWRKGALISLLTATASLGPFLVFAVPPLAYEVLGTIKAVAQLDAHRLALTALLSLIALCARLTERLLRTITVYGGVGSVACLLVAVTVLAGVCRWEVAPMHALQLGHGPRDVRDVVTSPNDASAIFPWDGRTVGASLAGAFYQGSSEPELRVLSAVYFPGSLLPTLRFSDYVRRPLYNQAFDPQLANKVVRILPTGRVVHLPGITDPTSGLADVQTMSVRNAPAITVRDAIPVRRVRALYVGSFTDYSYLWLNVVRCAPPGHFPVIPCLRPYDLKHHQQLDATRYWTGDVLVVDPEALQHPDLERLVRRARIVVVAHSSPALDRAGVEDVVRFVRKRGKRPIVLGPVHRPLTPRALRPLMRSLVRWDGSRVKGAVHLAANDRMVVNGVRSRLAVVPWAWAPFWAVNGREGETCPVGPYMLVRTGGKPAHLHYVAWERYQSRAYLCSAFLFVGLTAAAVTLSSARSRLKGAVGLS